MEGPENSTESNAGMIPRAVEQIYAVAKKLEEQGWEYKMEAQYLEIYNETLRDLLDSNEDQKRHDIKHDQQTGRTTVTDVTVGKFLFNKSMSNHLRKYTSF